MSLRDEIDQQIRFDLSANPVAREAMLGPGDVRVSDWRDSDMVLNAYCDALRRALLKVADEVDLLRGG
jgi:hypothetical protein